MTDHNNAPDEHTPEGGIPLPSDHDVTPADGPAPETMIGGDVVVDAEEVERTVAEVIGEGEPLPVGANDPEVKAEEPSDPPGMPHQPDDLDREMAQAAHTNYLIAVEGTVRRRSLRLDQATVPDALLGNVNVDLRPHNVREALLRHIAEQAEAERRVVEEYAHALRTVQETRDEYVRVRDARLGAAEALHVMGLDVEGDHEKVEPTANPIPDHVIV